MAGEKRREGIGKGEETKEDKGKKRREKTGYQKKEKKVIKQRLLTSCKRKPWIVGLEDSGLSVFKPPEYNQCNLAIANYTVEHTFFCSTSNTLTL